jgi:hypothetical protein
MTFAPWLWQVRPGVRRGADPGLHLARDLGDIDLAMGRLEALGAAQDAPQAAQDGRAA